MSELSRRELIGMMAALPAALALDGDVILRALRAARRALDEQALTGQAYQPKFFTPEEWRTVRVLVDVIIPRDARSGSATDAGVPEYMDFVMIDGPSRQQSMRDGLAWLDTESRRRFTQPFAELAQTQQAAILDDIAWPARAREGMAEGVRFFNMFRDQTAAGFWSSEMGVRDIGYIGNAVVPVWNGCPDAALRKLGVSYAEWEARRRS